MSSGADSDAEVKPKDEKNLEVVKVDEQPRIANSG